MTPTAAKAALARQLDQHGETLTFKRYSGTGASRSSVTDTARCRSVGYQPAELVGNVIQGDRRVIVYADDLVGGAITLPLRKNDKVLLDGRELNIEAVDDTTRRIAGTLIGYELQVRG